MIVNTQTLFPLSVHKTISTRYRRQTRSYYRSTGRTRTAEHQIDVVKQTSICPFCTVPHLPYPNLSPLSLNQKRESEMTYYSRGERFVLKRIDTLFLQLNLLKFYESQTQIIELRILLHKLIRNGLGTVEYIGKIWYR